jgi:DNA polymerase elongation subunit (family B)
MQQFRTDDVIIIDIETVSEFPNFSDLDDKWKHLWQEKVSRSVPEGMSAEEFYPMRAGVMAEFSKIVCISMGYFTKEENLRMRIKSFYGHDEKKILEDFVATLRKIESFNSRWVFAGHNIKEFDIPFMCRRMLIKQVPIPAFLDFQNMKPWETNIIDTFQYWRFGDYKHYTSLKLLAAAMGVPSPKDDIDGSMVGDVYWKENDVKRIATYCQKDVLTVANILLRFKNIAMLNPADIDFVE